MDRNDESFLYIEGIVRAALMAQIAQEEFWSIEKLPFEDSWEADPLASSVEETFNIQVSDSGIDTDFAEDDDPESLTNCYVVFDVTGRLADLFLSHGVRPSIEVDIFNDAMCSSISLLSDEDVENKVSLLSVVLNDPSLVDGLHASMVDAFGELGFTP